MKITDSVTLGDARVSDAGYLEVNARTARIGIQQYLGSEVGRPDIPVVNVYRDEAEVFSKRSLETFSKIPITNDHPVDAVNSENWRDLAVGTTGDDVLRDGEYLKIGLKITDADAVKAVKDGKRELSVGYSANLIWEDGVAPDGTAYQARQTEIRANHVAIVRHGRAGSQVRIGDDAAHWGAAPISTPTADERKAPMADNLRTVVVDGLSVSTTDQGAQAIEKLMKDLQSSAAKLTDAEKVHTDAIAAKDAEIAKKDEEIGTLKADLKKAQDSAPKPEDLDKMVADRAALVTTVKAIDAKIDPKGMTDADLRKAAVTAKLGEDTVKDASDAEITGMFRAISKDIDVSDAFAATVKDGVRTTQTADKAATEAYEAMVKDMQSAHRPAAN